MDSVVGWVRAAIAVLLGFWHALPELTALLVVLMGVDVLLGIVRAVKERNVSVQAMSGGITKKVVVMLMVGLAAVLNPHLSFLGVDLVQAASVFYIVPELTSITRNAALLDVPVFIQLQPVLAYFEAMSKQGKRS